MTAAKRAGLPVPEFHLSGNGGLFVMKRFDQDAEGCSRGFEDMCSLQALGAARKYEAYGERILGNGEFVESLWRETECREAAGLKYLLGD